MKKEKINYKDLTPKEKIKYQKFEKEIFKEKPKHYEYDQIGYIIRPKKQKGTCAIVYANYCENIKDILIYFHNQGYKIENNCQLESILKYKKKKLQLEYGVFLDFTIKDNDYNFMADMLYYV